MGERLPLYGLIMEGVGLMYPFGLTSDQYAVIKDRLAEKEELAQGRQKALFSILEQDLDVDARVALEFLYAFMPLVDLADGNGELFLSHVRHSLRSLCETPWGQTITGELFLHYVLPYRISNETMEDYRPYFWNELFVRVKDLSMVDAILEINHWCHEKATYIASDPRTLSPLNMVRNARGRCGEESALLVAALRSLGIPARQVYAPRWAHTDSNHAWVEAWADGEWYFLGACEPEPRLNMGWFDGPARRAMLIHTRVPGTIYTGPEERVQVTDDYKELNLLSRYAPVQRLTVSVKDIRGQAVAGADVDFQVFNYGGFASLAILKTDADGNASLTIGHGDLLVHVSKDAVWSSVFVSSASRAQTVEVVLGTGSPRVTEFTMHVPPVLPGQGPEVNSQERVENDRRLQEEDAIRAAYEATFVSRQQAQELASELGIDFDSVWSILEKARGNSPEIIEYLKTAVPEYDAMALELLRVLSAKDLTDTTKEILLDHLDGALPYEELYLPEDFINFILQPRVANEALGAYRGFFQQIFTLDSQEICRHNPILLKLWIDENIKHLETGSLPSWPNPQGTFELRAGHGIAKQILFVAMARSFGVPAQLSPIDGSAQYLHEDTWVRVDQGVSGDVGTIRIVHPEDHKGVYFHNFSLARLDEGVFRSLRFRGLDEEAFNDQDFCDELDVSPGIYRLTTGQRRENGDVFVTLRDFEVRSGEIFDLELNFPQETAGAFLGTFPKGISLGEREGEKQICLDELKGDGPVVLAWIDPTQEPTKHLMRDLKERQTEFDAQSISLVICLETSDPFNLEGLPTNTYCVEDPDHKALELVQTSLQEKLSSNLPIVVAFDRNGMIRYKSAGYQIGVASLIVEAPWLGQK